MKDRQRRLLSAIVNEQGLTTQQLMARFEVSRRTLYYDIEQLNDLLEGTGHLQNSGKKFVFHGSLETVRRLLQQEVGDPNEHERRQRHVLRHILAEQVSTVEQISSELDISRNTGVQVFDDIRARLSAVGAALEYKKIYRVVGDELNIRGLFISLLREDGKTIHEISDEVKRFNRCQELELTDFSLSFLNQLICFVRPRIEQGLTLDSYEFEDEASQFAFFDAVKELLPDGSGRVEQAYIAAFVATLPSLNIRSDSSEVDSYIYGLTDKFERQAMVPLSNRDDFIKNIRRHIQSSYYRIKYRFPTYTPVFEEIRSRHGHLYKIVKGIIQGDKLHPEFAHMRDEEIYFITAYFGAYLSSGVPKRVLIVCPSGLIISKSLELQLCRFIPGIRIVGSSSINALPDYIGEYDYIVSTVPVPDYDPVLVVSPLLTRPDVFMLMNTLVDVQLAPQITDIERVMEIIAQNCIIKDEARLYNQLLRELFKPPAT